MILLFYLFFFIIRSIKPDVVFMFKSLIRWVNVQFDLRGFRLIHIVETFIILKILLGAKKIVSDFNKFIIIGLIDLTLSFNEIMNRLLKVFNNGFVFGYFFLHIFLFLIHILENFFFELLDVIFSLLFTGCLIGIIEVVYFLHRIILRLGWHF